MRLKNFFLTMVAIAAFLINSVCLADTPNTTKIAAPTLVAFAGSARNGSFNKLALNVLVKAAINAGAEVKLIDLADYPMPMYNQDLEQNSGLPQNAKKLQQLINAADGILLASPEYNGLPTPLLINVLDWVSRVDKNNPQSGLKIFTKKVAGIISASPGGLGGKRSLPHVRTFLNNLGMVVVAEEASIGNAHTAFKENGELKNATETAMLENIAISVVKTIKTRK